MLSVYATYFRVKDQRNKNGVKILLKIIKCTI